MTGQTAPKRVSTTGDNGSGPTPDELAQALNVLKQADPAAHQAAHAVLAKKWHDELSESRSTAVTTLADLESILPATQWLWRGWLPRGYLSLLVGAPGVGKSVLALRLAASVLTGTPWPDGTEPTSNVKPVVWVDTEASQALLLERATAWKLPTNQILLPTIDPTKPLSDIRLDKPAGWGELTRIVTLHKPGLVVIDTLRGAHRGDENSSELITLLSNLAALARDNRIAVLTGHHLRKANAFENLDKKVTLDRVRGTSAITAMARVIMAIDRPNGVYNPDTARLSVIKSNLGRFPEPLGFTVTDSGLVFGDAPEKPRRESQLDRAIDVFKDLLRDGPVPASEVYEQLEGAGISVATAKRAKNKMGIVASKKGKAWHWSLPATPDK